MTTIIKYIIFSKQYLNSCKLVRIVSISKWTSRLVQESAIAYYLRPLNASFKQIVMSPYKPFNDISIT